MASERDPMEMSETPEGETPGEESWKEEETILQNAVSSFLNSKESWTMENLMDKFRHFIVEPLKEREKSTQLQIPAYISCEAFPSVMLFIFHLMNNELPEGSRMYDVHEDKFIVSMLRGLNPLRFDNKGHLKIIRETDLLDPTKDAMYDRTISEESERRLFVLASELLSGETEEAPLAREMKQRLTEIVEGHFPHGYNTENEMRWVMADRRSLFYAVPDYVHEITPPEKLYLERSALQMLDQLKEMDEETLKKYNITVEEKEEQCSRLQKILDGEYPYTYHLAPEEKE